MLQMDRSICLNDTTEGERRSPNERERESELQLNFPKPERIWVMRAQGISALLQNIFAPLC
jgi:hypothetical protein